MYELEIVDKATDKVIVQNLETFNRYVAKTESIAHLGKEEFGKMLEPIVNGIHKDNIDNYHKFEELHSPRTFCIANLKCFHDIFSVKHFNEQ